MRCSHILIPLLFSVAACGEHNPTTPTPTPTPPTTTTVPAACITLEGDLSFGNVPLGSSLDKVFTIYSNGGLTVSSITSTGESSAVAAIPTSGDVDWMGLEVTVRFTPAGTRYYAGTLNVQSNATSGNAGIDWSGYGVNASPWTMSSINEGTFTLPATATRVRITADTRGCAAGFYAWIDGTLVINTKMGTAPGTEHFEGTYPVTGGSKVAIHGGSYLSNGCVVAWTVAEVE